MTAFRLRGWHVLAAILAFFGAVVAVNTAFIVVALGTFPGEDVRRSYLQGLRFNDTLAERRAQAAQGWRATAGFSGQSEVALVEIVLNDAQGAPVEGASIEAALERPTRASLDHALDFVAAGAGRYVARAEALETGRWRLRARAARGEDALDFEAELTWPPSR
ncbi:MAG: FixH family protein [Hyphomonadaceae bacterium]